MSTLEKIAIILLVCGGLICHFETIEYFQCKITVLEKRVDNLEKTVICQNVTISNMNPDSLFNRNWFLFKLALIEAESNHIDTAVNITSKAGGPYQILPTGGFLQEVNRILGVEMYSDSSRFCISESTEIFEIYNQKYNPSRSIDRAIQLHNPLAGEWYRDVVLRKYERYQAIAHQL